VAETDAVAPVARDSTNSTPSSKRNKKSFRGKTKKKYVEKTTSAGLEVFSAPQQVRRGTDYVLQMMVGAPT
jgi:hypothetical protein